MTGPDSPISGADTTSRAAREALEHGWQPVPLRARDKNPAVPGWTNYRADPERVEQEFEEFREQGATNIGLLLGVPSGGLVDVDLDHPVTLRLARAVLPPTPMTTGRAGSRSSHRWYIAEGSIPATRRYKMNDGEVSVELRSTGGQTVVPPSIHPTGEQYLWEGEPWGGEEGPARVDGRQLAVQVAMMSLLAPLTENWPKRGGRHDAYLALAGGLLRYGDGGVSPYWERNVPRIIEILAEATHDDDGPETRVYEVMSTTVQKLREGGRVSGWPSLAEAVGEDVVTVVRRQVMEIEHLSGFSTPGSSQNAAQDRLTESPGSPGTEDDSEPLRIELSESSPLDNRRGGWGFVDLEPYILGEITPQEPTLLRREDGPALLYPGKVNSLYGSSESGKSWVALYAGLQEITLGGRMLFIDFEDGPALFWDRLKRLGVGYDDARRQIRYTMAEGPLASMQYNPYGEHRPTTLGTTNEDYFTQDLEEFDPTLIIIDGMAVLYGLHGMDPNKVDKTEFILSWVRKLTKGNRRTVIVIDHTNKGAKIGAEVSGSPHKRAMIQGAQIQAHVEKRPIDGGVGRLSLWVGKDREAQVRKHSTQNDPQQAALVEIDSTTPGATKIRILPPLEQAMDPPEVNLKRSKEAERAMQARDEEEQIKWVYGGELGRGMTIRELVSATGWPESRVKKVMDRMVEQEWFTVSQAPPEGRGRPPRLYVMALGAEGYSDDD